jgi:hypothetical protein
MNPSLKTIWVLALMLLVGGCASHRPRVDCEGHLRPINAPAPTAKGAHP